MMRVRDGVLVRLQDDLAPLRVDVQSSEDQNQPAESSEALHALQPVVI